LVLQSFCYMRLKGFISRLVVLEISLQ
jgi:hypothetical protein